MIVFVRPTGFPLGQTLGFSPNGSAASLDTAPVNAALQVGDMVLLESGGQLAKILATTVSSGGNAVLGPALITLIQSLPTTLPAAPGELWNNGGVLSLS